MKNFKVVFPIVCLLGMITSLVALFQSTNNDQIVLSIWMFIAFGFGEMVMVLNKKGIV